jgi:hypothetical protein
MRKVILALFALCASINVNAATTSTSNNLSAAINKSIEKQSSSTQHSTIVYGGKDISRSIVAVAHESTWTKQPVLIG